MSVAASYTRGPKPGLAERQKTPYTYKRLEQSVCQIRLLHLLPSNEARPKPEQDAHVNNSSKICCTFSVANLDDRPQYEALSYVWGDLSRTASITVDGHSFPVTYNLESALSHLRLEDKERVLWVDALCIDQSDNEERTFQVFIMNYIYSWATEVVIFLGEAWEGSDATIDLLKFVASHTDYHFYSSSEQSYHAHGFDINSRSVHESLSKFFDMRWWTRVWTVQEFVLAPQATFVLGHRTISPIELRQFMAQWHSHWDCCHLYNGLTSTAPESLLVNGLQRLTQLLHVTDLLPKGMVGFLEIVTAFRTRKCTNPIDKVYGMFGMAQDTLRASFKIDYSLSPEEAFREYVMATIRVSESLDCLSYVHGVGDLALKLPSYVPDFTAPLGQFESDSYYRRVGANYVLFKAARNSKATFQNDDSDEATTDAIIFDSIIDMNHTSIGLKQVSNASWEMFESHQTPPSPYTSRSDAFWRTFCGGLRAQPRSFDKIWCKPAKSADLHAYKRWLAFIESDDVTSNDKEVDCFSRAYSNVALGRRFAVTIRGYIGWVPANARNGDTLVILPGGRVPYVLRQVPQPSSKQHRAYDEGSGQKFQFLGDAYIHGIMNGEAYDEEKLKKITLV